MLYHLNQKQLAHVIFPLGEMNKKEVRALASKWDLPVKEKPESQEICFFGDKDYRDFLKRYLPKKYFKPGEIVDRDGNILGEHQGLINYTIGQRKGVEQTNSSKLITNSHNLKVKTDCHSKQEQSGGEESHNKIPLYVIRFDIKNNRLIVGDNKEVYLKEMIVSDVNWINKPKNLRTEELKNIRVKIRYRHEAVSCNIKYKKENIKNIKVLFDKPQRAITPGQSAVFYGQSPSREASAKWDEVLGGGIIAG
jgi:tRNA-specific 2-thiouridylase